MELNEIPQSKSLCPVASGLSFLAGLSKGMCPSIICPHVAAISNYVNPSRLSLQEQLQAKFWSEYVVFNYNWYYLGQAVAFLTPGYIF